MNEPVEEKIFTVVFQGDHCIFPIGNNGKSHLKSVPLYGKKSMVTYQYYGIYG